MKIELDDGKNIHIKWIYNLVHRIWCHFLCCKSQWTDCISCNHQSDACSCGEPETTEQVHTQVDLLGLYRDSSFFSYFTIFSLVMSSQ